jgi:hypothetical protein
VLVGDDEQGTADRVGGNMKFKHTRIRPEGDIMDLPVPGHVPQLLQDDQRLLSMAQN